MSELHTLGCEHAIVPWLRPEMRTPNHIEGLVERFSRWAAACRAEGLRFGYHNHDFEFAPAGGGSGGTFFDALIERTDPALVGFELDAYWAIYAGVDPIDLLRRHGARIPLLHVKDMGAGPERSDVPVGAGTIAWGPILEAATAAGVDWYVVEQDNPGDALADVATSLRGLEAIVVG